MQSQDWGHATSIPPRVNRGVCTVPLRDGLISVNNTDLVEAAGLPLNDSSQAAIDYSKGPTRM